MENTELYQLTSQEISDLLRESSADFPLPELDSAIWRNQQLLSKAKQRLLNIVSRCPRWQEIKDSVQDIQITGMLTTNLYQEDADLEVGIVLEHDFQYCDDIRDWSLNEAKMIGEHVVVLAVGSVANIPESGCYSLMTDSWIQQPLLVDDTYTPLSVSNCLVEFLGGGSFDVGSKIANCYSMQRLQEAQEFITAAVLRCHLAMISESSLTTVPSLEEALEEFESGRGCESLNNTAKQLTRYGWLRMLRLVEKRMEVLQS